MLFKHRRIATSIGYSGLVAGVFALDAVTPLGLNVPMLYLVPLLLAFLLADVRTRVFLTVVASLLTAVAPFWEWNDRWLFGVVNRVLDVGVYWVALGLSLRDLRTTGELRDLRTALDKASIVAVIDASGIIRHVNDRLCEISKFSRDELIGRDYHVATAGAPAAVSTQRAWSTIAGGRIWHGELQHRAKDGGSYWVDATIVPFLDRRGVPYQHLAIHRDITAQKRAEAALRHQASLARLGEMATIVAHEVRNPIAGVRAGLQVFERRTSLLPAEGLVVRQMVERLDRLETHVTDLLQFARPRAAQLRAVPIRRMVEDVVQLVRRTDPCDNLRWEIVGPDARVLGDDIMLREVFTNLLLNAVQALRGTDVGTITLTVVEIDESVDVLVADSGHGIPAALRERVFEPFYTTRPDGTGLGLAIVKQLVQLQGGEIEIVSSSGSGTTINVHLPRAAEVHVPA